MPDAHRLARMISPETPLVVINGQATDGVSSLDRGLLYGDGVFETIAVEDGRPRFWLRHLARLSSGCVRLSIPQPEGNRLLEEVLTETKNPLHVVARLFERGNATVLVDPSLARVVGRERQHHVVAIAIEEHSEVLHTPVDVVVRLVDIAHAMHMRRSGH